ncbi:phage portal protein [Megasphaera paucivorans]|uniref:Phage portal protein, SPP1 family n=1 Tax=Megasphaera paucivorans TaxID=349095 RepID=A0A1G9QVW4_9FIRM|nr:phage portal protein [Megasphaera paucivorans]SDM14747.1 phage portal protein, SPP1 family [Megasphaera paucivorans]
MNLDAAKKLITQYIEGHAEFISSAEIAERYYRVRNDILFRKPKKKPGSEDSEVANPLRNADNRIPHSFYELLVDQKAAYMFTTPPLFDVKNDETNQVIANVLGDGWAKKAKLLCVNASNARIAWLHYWMDPESGFQYGVVPSMQIIPVWSKKLDQKLLAVLRVYKDIDADTGDTYDVYEYWTDTECQAFRKRAADEIITGLMDYPCFTDFYEAGLSDSDNVMHHDFGTVPFIPFFNNSIPSSDLDRVKALIDAYDKTYSGFMDDLEDIQEVIFVLTNYGGAGENGELNKFLKDLKYYKAICTDSDGAGDKSGVSTLTIDIPVEARDKMLEITRKAIFDMGQGIDPQQQGLDATSGEAMKFLYALLELKAGLMETEFRLGFNELIRAICKVNKRDCGTIIQTWTRTSIRNDAELVAMCAQSDGIVSQKTILKHHPFVENVEDEEKQLQKEQKEKEAQLDSYDDGDLHEPVGNKGGEGNA